MKPTLTYLTLILFSVQLLGSSIAYSEEQFETLDPGPLPAELPDKPAPFDWRRDAPPGGAQVAGINRARVTTPVRPSPARWAPLFPPPEADLALRRRHEERVASVRRLDGSRAARAPGSTATIQSIEPLALDSHALQVKVTPVFMEEWTLQAGREYAIETRNVSADGATLLYILKDGRQVARSDRRSSTVPTARVRFRPDSTARYTLLIRASDEARAGKCDLFINGQGRREGLTFGGAPVAWSWQEGDRFQTAHLPSTYARPVDTLLFAFDGQDLVAFNDNGGIAGCSGLTLAEAARTNDAHLLVASRSADPAEPDWVKLYRNALSAGDTDGDTMADPLELSLGTDPESVDTDRDGLRDDWELFGVRTPNGEEDLPSYAGTGINRLKGSDPRVPDLFVEIDWMSGPRTKPHLFRPMDEAVDLVTRQFWVSGGIVLHVDMGQMGEKPHRGGQTIPYQEAFDRTGTEPLSLESCYASGDWFATSRRHLFAYILCASRFPDRNSSGHMVRFNEDGSINQSQLFNTTLNPAAIVCMATAINGSVRMESGTLMHELGHCLNLQHGGFESYVNFKPNYTSSMNYLFQFFGTDSDGTPDYSHGRNPILDERQLDEQTGLGSVNDQVYWLSRRGRSQPIIARRDDVRSSQFPTGFDWNCDGQVGTVPVRVDYNADGWHGLLRDFDDWSEVRDPNRGTLWVGLNAGVEDWASTAERP